MPTNPGRAFDILALAEDVSAGRRSLDNVIDQIAVGTPDDRARRAAVADLQDTVRALAAVRGHAAATASAAVERSGPDVAPAVGRTTSPPRVRSRGGAFGPAGAAAAGFTAIAGVLVVVLILASLRPTTVGPSASLPGGAVASSPGASGGVVSSSSPSAGPAASSVPSPTAGAAGSPVASAAWTPDAPRFVLWTRTDTAVTLWQWDPASGAGLRKWLVIETWSIPYSPNDGVNVLVSPDASRIAVVEHAFGDPASHDRTRVFDASGRVLWTSPADQPETIDLAWSIDGTMLALGAIPAPWTVVTFGPNGTADAATYNLTADGAYRLLAFSADDARLIGYETSGEAAFWDKPVALDLAHGTVAPLENWPAGMDTNATGPVQQINPDGGSVIAQPGRAKGTPDRVIRSASGDQPLNLDPGAQVQWSSADAIDWIVMNGAPQTGQSSSPPPAEVWTRPAADTSGGTNVAVLPRGPGDYGTLVSSHGAVAVVALRVQATYPGGDPGWRDFTAVDLGSGAVAKVASPGGGPLGTGLWFAGWVGAATGSTPSPSSSPSPSAPSQSPSATPPPSAASASPAPTTVPSASADAIADAPDAAFWSTDVVPGKLTLWRWSPSRGPGLTDRLDIDTWTSGTFSTQVVVSPDGRRIAVTEFGGPTSRLNRTRVLDNQGRLLWTSPDGADPTPDMVWSPDGTKLALGAVPSPWTVLVFTPSGQVDSTTYDVGGGAGAYRIVGFAHDGARIIGYDSSGEAGFADSIVSLDLAHGPVAFTPLTAFPAGMASNGTTSRLLDRINDATGDALTLANDATAPDWVLRHNGSDASFGLGISNDLVWADDESIAIVGPASPSVPGIASASPGTDLGISVTSGPTAERRQVMAFPGLSIPSGQGAVPTNLIGARGGNVLVYVGAPPCCVGDSPTGTSEVMLVNVHSQATARAIPPDDVPANIVLLFAGWISPSS